MPDVRSTYASLDAPTYFPPSFNEPACVHAYRRVIRAHPAMQWARARSLGEDLEQVALLEIPRILRRYDSNFGASPEQFVRIALAKRLYSVLRSLQRMYSDAAGGQHEQFVAFVDEIDGSSQPEFPAECAFLEYATEQTHAELKKRICCLPNRQREVVEMMLRGETESEIASQLRVSVQSVNKSKQGAIKALRRLGANESH